MGLGEQQSENNNWYETSEQRQIDKDLVDAWMKKVYEQHKELGIDFDQSYQNQVNAAAARINAFEAYQKERQQRLEQEAETQRLTQELNTAVGDVNEGLLRNGEAANRNAQQMAGEQQAKEGLRQLAENLSQAAAEAEQTPIPVLGAAYSSTAVNLVIGGTDYGYVPAQVAYEQTADSSSVSIPEKSAIASVIDAFKKGEFRIGDYGVRFRDGTEQQKALARTRVAEFGAGMNFLLPWVGGGGLASIGGSARTIGRVGLAVEGPSKAEKLLSNQKYFTPKGEPIWPPNRGFAGETTEVVLKPGTRLDRYGQDTGQFVSPEGTPLEMRSLPPGAEKRPYHIYEVVKEFKATSGEIAEWFGQPGKGIQYEFNQTIQELLDAGIIREVKP